MSRIRADRYTNRAGTGAPTFADGVNVVGITSVNPGAGTTSMLVTGDLSVISGTIKGASELSISGITSSISDTAVDVFVYDTRKDSDGGAWRKRTQNTSWYNDTLNSATRGSRREFPAVAVIVAEASKVTIYDGDDPDLPLWMSFPTNDAKAVTAINGEISLGAYSESPSYHDLLRVNFVADQAINHRESGSVTVQGYFIYTLSSTDRAKLNDGPASWTGYRSEVPNIVNGYCNDVAMTVLPNAPIDDATGLPIPTIAVATNGGTSVIKDDGTVADITGFNPVHTIHIDSNSVIGSVDTSNTDYLYKTSIPTVDVVYDTDITAGSANYYMNSTSSGTIPILRDLNVSATAYNSKDDTLYRGGNNGFDVIKAGQAVSNTVSNSLIAYLTSDYNTGYMHRDIKGAFLSDTDTTNATELVTNGYFNSDLSDWTTPVGASTLDSNRLLITAPSSGSSWGYAYTSITTEIGKTYKISLHYDRGTTDGRLVVKNDSTNSSAGLLEGAGVNSGGWRDLGAADDSTTVYATFTATAETTFILVFAKSTSGGTSAYDQISVTLEKDRSVNNKGLQVYGTVTKSAVATGADLVAYSGFSASNYLKQPYNSDIMPGTGSFCVIGWYNQNSVTPTNEPVLLSIGSLSDTSKRLQCAISNDNRLVLWTHSGIDFTYVTTPDLGSEDSSWYQVIYLRDTSGYMRIYRNGIEQPYQTNLSPGTIRDISWTDAVLQIGTPNYDTSRYFEGNMSLWRFSSSIPSSEQIKKMYEDEKYLFQENAKATLYGSSDAVTALAYDDTTELLHVGTSAGRSEFQGLKRINNTTTAVTTAISASNELVAEQ